METKCLLELLSCSLAVSKGLLVQLWIGPIVTRLAQKPSLEVDFRLALASMVNRIIVNTSTIILPSSSLVYNLTPILYMLGALYRLPARRGLDDMGGGIH